MSEVSRLRWLCRRGMKELDLLMENYLSHDYPTAPESDQQAFQTLLNLPDPELYDLVLGRSSSDDESIRQVIGCLRASLQK